MLPGLGYPARPENITDEKWQATLQRFARGERIGGAIALTLLAVGLVACLCFWILYLSQ